MERLGGPRLEWFHWDDEKLSDRVVKILKPQLRSDLSWRKSKTQLLGARINVRQRRSIGLKAEFGRRHRKKLRVCFRSAEGKGRSSENLPNQISDAATSCIQRFMEGERIWKIPYSNRLPHPNIGGGFD